MTNQSVNNRRIVKNTGLLYVRQLLTLGLSLYTSRLTLEILGETDFGIYATVAGFTALLSTLTNSLASGTQRFITYELGKGDINKLNKVYCTSINIHVILSIILVILAETIGVWFIFNEMTIPEDRLMIAFWVFQTTILNTVFSILNAPNSAQIIAHEDMGTWGFVAILESVLKFLAVILLFFIEWNLLLSYAISLLSIQMIIRLISVIWCKKKYPEVKFHLMWDSKLLISMLNITGWTGLNNLAIATFIQGVNVLLNIFFGPILNAAYTIAMQAYLGIRQFCSSFQLASSPQIVKLYAQGDLISMQNLLESICKLSFFLVLALGLPFIINANYILSVWLNEVPSHCENFFVLLLIYAFIDVLAYPLDIAAQATGKLKKYSIVISICTISSLIISYIGYFYGMFAEFIYIVAIVVSCFSLVIRLYLLINLINLQFNSFIRNVVLKIVYVGTISILLSLLYYYYISNIWLGNIILFILTFLTTISVIYFIGLTHQEKIYIKNTLSKFKQRI